MKSVRSNAVSGILLGIMICLSLVSQTVRAGFVFGEPTKLPGIALSDAAYPQISRDGLELYFAHNELKSSGGGSCTDIWVMRRLSTQETWSDPVKLDAPVNSAWPEHGPAISPNGLELYFADSVHTFNTSCQAHPNGQGMGDLWVARRASKEDPWGTPENLGPTVNSDQKEDSPSLSADGLSLYFQSDRSGGQGYFDLYVATRPSLDAPWGPPENVGVPINTNNDETTPFLSPDGLSLYFSVAIRTWSSTSYVSNMYVSHRKTVSSPWETPRLFAPVQMPGLEYNLTFSENDSTLYFANGGDFFGPFDLWKVDVALVLDFNEDGSVDESDAFSMVLNWGPASNSTSGGYPLYDIAPYPCGDGVVDAKDLLVLAEYMIENTEEVDDTATR